MSGNDLGKKTGRDVSHFDEPRVKEEYVRPVHGNALCSAFPLDRSRRTARRPMLVHVNAEFYERVSSRLIGCNHALPS